MSMTVEKKKCIDCGASEIYADGIYCNSCKRFVGRSNEQTCILTDSVKNEMSMTESERLTFKTDVGISIDKNEDCPTCSICWNCDRKVKDCNYFNDAIERLAMYEDIGTVSEFRELKEKATAKKPYYVQYDVNPEIGNYHCPTCERFVLYTHPICSCGQKLDWSEGKE